MSWWWGKERYDEGDLPIEQAAPIHPPSGNIGWRNCYRWDIHLPIQDTLHHPHSPVHLEEKCVQHHVTLPDWPLPAPSAPDFSLCALNTCQSGNIVIQSFPIQSGTIREQHDLAACLDEQGGVHWPADGGKLLHQVSTRSAELDTRYHIKIETPHVWASSLFTCRFLWGPLGEGNDLASRQPLFVQLSDIYYLYLDFLSMD